MIKPLLDLAKKHTWLFETDYHTFDLFSRSGGLCHGSKACGNTSEVNPTAKEETAVRYTYPLAVLPLVPLDLPSMLVGVAVLE